MSLLRVSKVALSSNESMMSWMVFFMTKDWTGQTMIRPELLAMTLNALGYTFTSPNMLVSQSRETSTVRIAAVLPESSLTGIEKVVISISPPPSST